MLLRAIDPKGRYDKEHLQVIANRIEYIDLKRFIQSRAVLFEGINNLRYPAFKSDRAWMDDYFKTNPFAQPPADLSHWCVRFEPSEDRDGPKARVAGRHHRAAEVPPSSSS